jgi:hypothetical protein
MAKALKCPACGATHRLDGLNGATKFRCDDCGQSLKVPVVASSTVAVDGADESVPDVSADAPDEEAAASVVDVDADADDDDAGEDPDARSSEGNGSGTRADAPIALATASVPPPPPRRHAPGAPRGREIIGASATVSASGGARAVSTPAPTRDATPERRRVRWYWRVLAWIAAVPIGFVITVWPAYEFGLISKDDVLDVFVGSGAGRYTRLAIVTVLWALVTALLVQLFVEGGRWWAARRRARPEPAPSRGASAAAS